MTALLLAFPGGLSPVGDGFGGVFPDDSLDSHAAVGRQFTVRSPGGHPLLPAILELVRDEDEYVPPVDLVVRGVKGGLNRGWFYTGNAFQSDRHDEVHALDELLALASPETPLTFTVLPPVTGKRIGVDRDGDGIFDRTEIDYGTDPSDPLSHPGNQPPQLDPALYRGAIHPGMMLRSTFSATDLDSPLQTLTFSLEPDAPPGAFIDPVSGLFKWTPVVGHRDSTNYFRVRVTDSGSPPLAQVKIFHAVVLSLRLVDFRFNGPRGTNLIIGSTLPGFTLRGQNYRLQYKDRLEAPAWVDSGDVVTANGDPLYLWDSTATNTAQRFYRVILVE